MSARLISEIESGSLLPNPTATSYGSNQGGSAGRTGPVRLSLQAMASKAKWPTIRSTDGERGGRGDLIQAVRGNENSHFRTWQTPTVQDARGRDRHNQKDGSVILSLLGQARLLPTPTTQDVENNGAPSQANRNSPPLNSVAGGALNPEWVAWLMGWPIGWTSLEPLGMDKFQQWLLSHGGC
jgi:hypothetical protein